MTSQIIIIGAGPAGLAAAAALKKQGIASIVLEQSNELAHSWKTHYDRLKLNSVKQLSSLPYLSMSASYPRYPSRSQIVSYLENYAKHFEIKPKFSTQVLSIDRAGDEWIVNSNNGNFKAPAVIVATGFNHKPRIPEIPGISEFQGEQIHSKEFRNGATYKGKKVLVIGAGNSGAEIAMDLMEHEAIVSISIRNPIHVAPLDLFGIFPAQATSTLLNLLPLPMADFIAGMTLKIVIGDLSKWGIKRPKKGPLRTLVENNKVAMFDTGIIKAIKNGKINVVPGITSASSNGCTFADGTFNEYDAIIYATGYDYDLSGMLKKVIEADKYPNLTNDGYPLKSGRDIGDGLYFIGFKESPRGMLADIKKQAIEIADSISKSASITSS